MSESQQKQGHCNMFSKFEIRIRVMTVEKTAIFTRVDAKVFLCSQCDNQVTIAYRDYSNTQWFSCPNCGYVTNTKKLELTREQKRLREAYEIQAEQNGERYIDPLSIYSSFCDNKGIFKPALVAEWIKANHKFKTCRETETLYFYDGTVWRHNGEPYLKEIVANLLGENDRKSHYENIKFHLMASTQENIIFSKKIAFENGLMDVEKSELAPFNSDEMPVYKLPVKYDPEAKCSKWEQFISQIVKPEDLPTLQEWSGYLLLPDYRFHKIAWMHGDGRNGKGVWSRTMEAVIGKDNVSSIGLEEFDGSHRFALEQLYGKLLNICPEPATNKALQTNLLKKATGQDLISAEIKGKQARRDFLNAAKMAVMANRFPKAYDRTTAFKERRLIIPFPFEFTGEHQIVNIEQNWLKVNDERSGILNWMLEGLHRLLQQGHFTESRSQQEAELEYLRASDSIGAFLSEMPVRDKVLTITRKDSFDQYNEYCEILGIPAENEHRFNGRLKSERGVTACTVTKNGKRERAWKGISFKKLNDDGTVTDVTSVTGFTYPNIFSNQKIEEVEIPVTSVTPVTPKFLVDNHEQSKKPIYYLRNIPVAEKCECGKFAVTKEIITPLHDTIRRCEACTDNLYKAFPAAEFRQAYPDLSNSDELEN